MYIIKCLLISKFVQMDGLFFILASGIIIICTDIRRQILDIALTFTQRYYFYDYTIQAILLVFTQVRTYNT